MRGLVFGSGPFRMFRNPAEPLQCNGEMVTLDMPTTHPNPMRPHAHLRLRRHPRRGGRRHPPPRLHQPRRPRRRPVRPLPALTGGP